MHVGYSPIFQNLGNARSDYDVYRDELRLIDLVEPLGFESIWQPEHHFTDYEMTPDVLQFLTYCAGRTRHAKLGSMVIVLPWHDPIRVAEQVMLLDHVSDGRAIFGMGRGLGAVEFDGFRINMADTRGIFNESAEAIVAALKTGTMEFDGQFIKQPRRDIRPAPFKSFEGRLFGAGLSPESGPTMARLGLAMLITPLKAWTDVRTMLDGYAEEWRRVHADVAPPKCTQVAFCYVDKDPGRAKAIAEEAIGTYYHAVLKHYDLGGDRVKDTKGYEFYKNVGAQDTGAAVRNYIDLMPWGTPEQVIRKFRDIHDTIDNNGIIAHFAFGGMAMSDAERSMRLFAAEVLPALKAIETAPYLEPARRTAIAA